MTKKEFSRARQMCGTPEGVRIIKRIRHRQERRVARRLLHQGVYDLPPVQVVTDAWTLS